MIEKEIEATVKKTLPEEKYGPFVIELTSHAVLEEGDDPDVAHSDLYDGTKRRLDRAIALRVAENNAEDLDIDASQLAEELSKLNGDDEVDDLWE